LPDDTLAEDTIVQRKIYVLANDPRTKFPDWVAYSVSKGTKRHGDMAPLQCAQRADA